MSMKSVWEQVLEEKVAEVKKIRDEAIAECHKIVQEAHDAGEKDFNAVRERISSLMRSVRPAAAVALDAPLECRSGYHIATRADGTQYCEEDAAQ